MITDVVTNSMNNIQLSLKVPHYFIEFAFLLLTNYNNAII
ncbi:hypothetical protein DFQ11_102247 [Winogradskyella epiphytica]|uniref:Uncharacterized protein n=1 Tax=Winogradskyella epiphytica TaxID=262005 RepID=A0A2V4XJ46_9FLAO|nr:hypothetical protein DFQ11_102247 [Winogradskyella epiphytica]